MSKLIKLASGTYVMPNHVTAVLYDSGDTRHAEHVSVHLVGGTQVFIRAKTAEEVVDKINSAVDKFCQDTSGDSFS